MTIPRTITLTAICFLASCASKPITLEDRTIDSTEYERAFQAAKDVLRDYEFELDRVDAARGVITTAPRAWSGAATPWLPYTSTPGDAVEGFMQFEQRTARVLFHRSEPVDGASNDLRVAQGPVTAEVAITVERLYRPGRRVDATSVRLAGFTSDPKANPEGGPPPAFASEHRADDALAASIRDAIQERLNAE